MIAPLPTPRPSSSAVIFFFASGVARPSSGPELTATPSPANASFGSGVDPSAGLDHLNDGEVELLREGEVALVVGRHRHDGAGAVGRQDVVGDPDRDLLAVDGVRRGRAGGDAGLILCELGPFEIALGARRLLIRRDRRALSGRRQVGDQRVLGRQDHVRRAVERVGTGGEDADLLAGDGRRRREGHLGPLAAADPVALHGHRRGGPVQLGQILGQPVRVARDPEQPLAQILANDRGAAALAAPLAHLFVGQARLARRAPVDRDDAFVGEAALEELEEDPLRPLHVRGIGGVDLTLPVVGEADRVDLAAEVGDRLGRRDAGVDAVLDGVVLGRQPERVPPHRVEDPEALHPLPAGDDVGGGVALAVADVQPGAGRVGEHVQRVELRLRRIGGGLVQAGLAPAGLPFGFDGVVVVGHRNRGL